MPKTNETRSNIKDSRRLPGTFFRGRHKSAARDPSGPVEGTILDYPFDDIVLVFESDPNDLLEANVPWRYLLGDGVRGSRYENRETSESCLPFLFAMCASPRESCRRLEASRSGRNQCKLTPMNIFVGTELHHACISSCAWHLSCPPR